MHSVVRSIIIYAFLLVIFRLAGKRTLSQTTTFDFVLLLIISEATQQALLGDDFSITNAILAITTLVGLDIGLSLVKQRWPRTQRVLEGLPVIVVEHGRPLKDRLNMLRVDEDDVLESARQLQGLERMEQIRFAILEPSGGITIVPEPAWQEKEKSQADEHLTTGSYSGR